MSLFQRSSQRRVPGLNTTATADISFMLLIFFLVTSSMDTDKGLPRQLPPPQDELTEQQLKVKERNVLRIALDGQSRLTCNDEPIGHEALTQRIAAFVQNEHDDALLPEKSTRDVDFFGRCQVSDRHVLLLSIDREATYDAYFQLQNAIVKAYNELRNQLALKHFGHPYARCTAHQRDAIAIVYPQRISEEAMQEPLQSP